MPPSKRGADDGGRGSRHILDLKAVDSDNSAEVQNLSIWRPDQPQAQTVSKDAGERLRLTRWPSPGLSKSTACPVSLVNQCSESSKHTDADPLKLTEKRLDETIRNLAELKEDEARLSALGLVALDDLEDGCTRAEGGPPVFQAKVSTPENSTAAATRLSGSRSPFSRSASRSPFTRLARTTPSSSPLSLSKLCDKVQLAAGCSGPQRSVRPDSGKRAAPRLN